MVAPPLTAERPVAALGLHTLGTQLAIYGSGFASSVLIARSLGAAGRGAYVPDLVVHWTEAACARPVRVAGLGVEAMPIAARMTGQHTYQGFCVARGLGERVGGTLKAEDHHRILSAAVVA